MKGLSILGSTGLRGHERAPRRGRVPRPASRWSRSRRARNVERLAEQVARYRPRVVSVATPEALATALARLVDLSGVQVGVGEDGAVAVATQDDASMVVAAAVGAVGLVPTYRALEAGKDVALANKETLVMAGELMVAEARAHGGRLLPIDSEHCALHQCLDGRGAGRGAAPGADRLGRALPHAPAGDLRPHHAARRRSAIRPGRWAARSRSTRPRS